MNNDSLQIRDNWGLEGRRSLTVSEALNAFAQHKGKKSYYLQKVKQFLLFTIDNDLSIHELSRDQYLAYYAETRRLATSVSSPIRQFVHFASEAGIYRVVTDPVTDRVPPAANELILGYLSSAKNLRGKKTKITYTNVLNAFFVWLEEQQKPFFFPSVSSYVDYLIGEDRSPFTINLYLSVIKQLAKWVVQSRHRLPVTLDGDQLESLRDIQYIRGLVYERTYYKESLTAHQREVLRQSIQDSMWRSIVSLMSYAGLRSIEITRLRRRDVDLSRRTIDVKGKGKYNYERIKLLGASVEDLDTYLRDLGDAEARKAVPLYPSVGKEEQVQSQVKKYLSVAGLAYDKLTPHSLRHTAAQLLVDQGVNPVYVQQQLRHASFDVTQFYVRNV